MTVAGIGGGGCGRGDFSRGRAVERVDQPGACAQRVGDDSDIVLIDFGFADKCSGRSLSAQCGTPNYVAPEVLAKRPYACEADLWSCGVIAFILLGGYPVRLAQNVDVKGRRVGSR